MLDIARITYDVFDGRYRPPERIELPSQKELSHLPVVEAVAWDPENPREIDDAFAVVNRPKHPLEVYTVLARGGLIPYTSEAFAQAAANLWSVYTSDEPELTGEQYRPMIDDIGLVSDELSLVSGALRPGLALVYKLARSSGRTFDHRYEPVAVRATQSTYHEAGERLIAGEYRDILFAVNAIRRYDGRRPLRINGHSMREKNNAAFSATELFARKIVQEIMVHTNKEFGRIPPKRSPYPRRITRRVLTDPGGRLVKPGGTGTEIVRAYYSTQRGVHEPLETRSYTHTTSPLRRFADLLAHQILEAQLMEGFKLEEVRGRPLALIIRHINRQIDAQAVRPGREF